MFLSLFCGLAILAGLGCRGSPLFHMVLAWLIQVFLRFVGRSARGRLLPDGLIHLLAPGWKSSKLLEPTGCLAFVHIATVFQENDSRSCKASWILAQKSGNCASAVFLLGRASGEASHIQEGRDTGSMS